MTRRHKAQIVLPVAFLLAVPGQRWTVASARQAVANEPRLSALLETVLVRPTSASNPTSSVATPPPVSASERRVVGVDLGGTHIRAAVMDHTGRFCAAIVRRKIVDRSAGSVLNLLAEVIDAAIDDWRTQTGASAQSVDLIAVGQPGHVEADGSISRLAAFDNWGTAAVPVSSFLRTRFPQVSGGIVVYDDALCASAGEVQFGAGRLARTVVVVTVGMFVFAFVFECL
jgi:hypothetical protein